MNKKELIKYVKGKERLFLIISFMYLSVLFIIVGGFMNSMAVNSNNGKMPVYADYLGDSDYHFSFTEKNLIKFFYFSDIFKAKIGHLTEIYYSVGDVVISVGMIFTSAFFIVGLFMMIRLRKNDKEIKRLLKNETRRS